LIIARFGVIGHNLPFYMYQLHCRPRGTFNVESNYKLPPNIMQSQPGTRFALMAGLGFFVAVCVNRHTRMSAQPIHVESFGRVITSSSIREGGVLPEVGRVHNPRGRNHQVAIAPLVNFFDGNRRTKPTNRNRNLGNLVGWIEESVTGITNVLTELAL